MIGKIKTKIKDHKIRKAREREYLENLPSSFDDEVISWIAPEFIKYEKGIIWKVAALFSVISAAVIGFLHGSWTFSLAILAFAAVYYQTIHRKHPENVKVILSEVGVKIGKRRYPYSKIKGFWILYEPPYLKILHIRVQNDMAVDIAIYLNSQDPAAIREFLMEKIPEMENRHESLTDIFVRLLKL